MFEFFQLLGANIWLYGGAFLLVLSILVFVHEWGHYIVARWCGIKVEVFSIGFGKEIFGFNDKNGTRWKFSLVPLGGFVQLFGHTDPESLKKEEKKKGSKAKDEKPLTEAEKKTAFFAKPVWQRALVVVAGPAINYIFAIIIMSFLFMFNGQPVTPPTAAAIVVGSSADRYGFEPHDMILEIDDKAIRSFEDIRREMMIGLDGEKKFTIQRGEKVIDIMAKPDKVENEDRFGFKHSRGLLGLISPRHAIAVDSITAIEGKSYDDPDAVKAALLKRMDSSFQITIKNGPDSTDSLIISPVAAHNEALADALGEEFSALAISDTSNSVFVQYGPAESVAVAVTESWDVTIGTLEALGQMIMGSRSATELGGIIRIGALAGDMAQQGLIALIMFMALLSINLGLINLFPIPMLDGGHLLFFAFEAVLGKPIPEQIQEYAFRFGLVFLVGIMVYANLNDIMQLVL